MKRNSQYALYKGEKLVEIGTKRELAELLKVRVETIAFYTTPTHRKRLAQQKRYREKKKLIKENEKLKKKIENALNKINNMFEVGDEYKIIDDLLELMKILKEK